MQTTQLRSRGMKHGRVWEFEFFGFSIDEEMRFEYASIREALCKVAEIQVERNWDPSNPPTKIAKKLFELVKGLLRPEDREDLQLYCALHTVLDQFHRGDGFFKIRENVVMLDLTVNANKEQGRSVLLRRSDLKSKRITEIATQIVKSFYDSMDKKSEVS